MIPQVCLVLVASAVAAGCAPTIAERTYPASHPASAEAPAVPFIRLANVLAGEVPFPAVGGHADAPMSHGGMDHSMMDHGGAAGMDHAAMGHGPAGETSTGENTEMAQAKTADATGTGTVHSVDAGQRTVNVSHDRIPSIGWPAMTMDFQVAPSVDLSSIEPESRVAFTLARGADGMYVIESLRPASGDSGAMPGMDHEQMDHGSMPGMDH